MQIPKSFYALMAFVGTIVPWFFFAYFFAVEGVNIPLFLRSLFANGAAGGFAVDVLLSLLVFWIWSYTDAQKHGVRRWWLVFLGGATVGLSLALPLYFYLRADRVAA